jgi:hypothetical protein
MKQRHTLDEYGSNASHILLGAAWVADEDPCREFLQFAECLFVDTIYGTIKMNQDLSYY